MVLIGALSASIEDDGGDDEQRCKGCVPLAVDRAVRNENELTQSA